METDTDRGTGKDMGKDTDTGMDRKPQPADRSALVGKGKVE